MKVTGLKIELIWDQRNRSTLPYGLGGYTPTRWIAAKAKPYDLSVNGTISLDPSKPGFGVQLRRELLAPFKG